MTDIIDRTWRDRAACRGHDPELWFPAESKRGRAAAAIALQICGGCPVKTACRNESQRLGDVCGVWGGHLIPQAEAYNRYHSPMTAAGCGTPAGARRHQRAGTPVCRACTQAAAIYKDELRRRKTVSA